MSCFCGDSQCRTCGLRQGTLDPRSTSGVRTHKQIGDVAFSFTRRRYGRTTYTWAVAILPDGTRLDLSDPWPAVIFPKRALMEAFELAELKRRQSGGAQ